MMAMKKKKLINLLIAVFCTLITLVPAYGQSQRTLFTVNPDHVQAEIQPTMWGIFFEDINMGADGGIYAELVKNRSFEFASPMMGWKEMKDSKSKGSYLIINNGTADQANRHYIRLEGQSQGYGISNEGFRGMGIKKGNGYDFSVWARQVQGSQVSLTIQLLNSSEGVLGEALLTPSDTSWRKYTVSFKSKDTEPKAHLSILLNGAGKIDLDMISLFPQDTWKHRPGGLRADMVQLLADMKPGFLRFPGGCIVEGRNLDERFQWKKTIGKVEDRKLLLNRWNVEFKHRPTPDYFQSFGLGFYEYFQLCEDIGAEPLPILNCGMACQFNTAEVAPMDQLGPYIQDALDLIEFANGPVNSVWGSKRAEMGHPAPFNLKMLGVGNENWGPQYIERLKAFTRAIKAKYPTIKLVNSSGTDPNGERFDYLNGQLRQMNVDLIDEHYYRPPQWFLDNAQRYDHYDRQGPKIFAGEYAAQSVATASPENKNTWKCALSEAAFMTGLERNADVVYMASYAPLFAHAEGWQWTPDLIWVDNLRSYGTANYQVQKLFSVNKGTEVVSLLLGNAPATGQNGYYGSASIDKKTNTLIIKLVNSLGRAQTCSFILQGKSRLKNKGQLIELSSEDLEKVNSFDQPQAISPVIREIKGINNGKTVTLKPYSVNVLRIPFS